MRLFVDQCVMKQIRDPLIERGLDVVWAGDVHRGEFDDVLIEIAFRDDRLLVTTDRDFGDWVVRKKLPTIGIVYARLDRIGGSLRDVGMRIADVLINDGDACRGHVSTIEASRVRRRSLDEEAP
jgi:predicted nuclease of predicted toxin-antitoxin system